MTNTASPAHLLLSIPVWSEKPRSLLRQRSVTPSAVIDIVMHDDGFTDPSALRFEVRGLAGVPGTGVTAVSVIARTRTPRAAVAVLLSEVAEYAWNDGAGDGGPEVAEALTRSVVNAAAAVRPSTIS